MNDNEERVELPCPMCRGIGYIAAKAANPDPALIVIQAALPCDMCFGEGWIS